MNQELIDLCWKKRRGEISTSWDYIAAQNGYTSGEKLRLSFKSWRRKNERESGKTENVVVGIEDYKKYYNTLTTDKKPRLVVSDIHLPFAVDGWLEFIKETHKRFDCNDEIIINGDLWDFHFYSFHTTETDAMNGIDEFDKAKTMTKELAKAFPNVKLTLGNHDNLLVRRIKELGIDKRFTKTLHELFELPSTWIIADDFIIDNVYYKHIGCNGGKTGHINSAISNRMSTVSSHLHADGGIGYCTSPNGETIFGLNSGALCDDDAYAFRYGVNSRFKATLGCGVVISDKEAYFVPMIK